MLAKRIFPTILLSAAVPLSPTHSTLKLSRPPSTTIFLVNLEIPELLDPHNPLSEVIGTNSVFLTTPSYYFFF